MSELTISRLIRYLLIILLIGLVIGSISLVYPFGRDQGIYAYAGQKILEGKLQYKHVFDLKPPSVHFTYALGELVIGSSMFSLRLFDLLWQCLTAFTIFIICFRLTSARISSLIAAVLYLFLYYRFDYWQTLQADSFLNLPFAISVLLLLSEWKKKNTFRYFFAGIFFGIAVFYKYTIFIFIPLFLIVFYFYYKKNENALKSSVLYLSGIFSVAFVFFVIFLSGGALKEFIDVNFVQLPNYAKIGFRTERDEYIAWNIIRLFTYSIYSPLILLSAFHFFILIKNKKLDYKNALILIWILSVLFNLIIQWKFFKYHFTAIFPPLVTGGILGYESIKTLFSKYRFFIPAAAVLLLIYLSTSFNTYSSNYSDISDYVFNKKLLNEIYEEKGVTDSTEYFIIKESFKAVNYLKDKTQKNDYVYIWGFDPVVYYLADRECASRFIYNLPLYWNMDNKEFRNELITDLKSKMPKALLVSKNDSLYLLSEYYEDSKQMVQRYPELKQFIGENYRFDYESQNFDYYQLKITDRK